MSRRRCMSAIALGSIVFLCALVVTVWVQFSQGAFDRRQPYAKTPDSITTSDDSSAQSTTARTAAHTEGDPQNDRRKELLEKTHLDENLGSQQPVYVRPLKINPDDENEPLGTPLERHHSGHFRHQSAEIWDPHPKYEIDAFGRKLLLQLEHNDKFVAPNLHIVTHDQDAARMRPHDPKILGCFYTGKLLNDSNSAVAVSLCHGMTGYIRSSQANYYIEPAENFTRGSLDTILHRIKMLPHAVDDSNDILRFEDNLPGAVHNENGSHSIVEDDFPEDVLEPGHSIKKRYAPFAEDFAYGYQRIQEINSMEPEWNEGYVKQSNEYFIKVLVVADNTMLEYHRSKDELTKYIMILMAYVTMVFKEPSIGNAINVSLVDIQILKDPSYDFSTRKSTDMLQRFCEWQRANILDKRHDIALLLTRRAICKTLDSCSTLGVAEVSSMCGSSSCTIVKDKGLSTSYTIAHEFGHALSMIHDDEPKCRPYNYGQTNNIMSRSTSNDSKPFMWSPCSRQFVTDFLDSPKSKCLLYAPFRNEIHPNYTQMLPGDNFELDRQCELEFGPGQTRCTMGHIYNPPCVHMWCKDGHNGCINNYSPWAEGTKCGINSWCYKRECVREDRRQVIPVDGGWGEWQPWGPCSRTCGGGIKKSERQCDSPIPANGGNYCTGKSVKYISCNAQNCEEGAIDFREYQCAQFNGITKGLPNLTQDVQWVPKYGLGSPERTEDYCRLFCKPQYSHAYYPLKDKVIDGTKCGKSGFDICVNGMCRPGGCDNVMDSKSIFDECGICGGDNSQCQEIAGTYNKTADQVRYSLVVRIPRGSSNIKITQTSYGVDENFLALRDGETNEYILNGNQMLNTQEMDLQYGPVVIKYSGSRAKTEWISTMKPMKLKKDLIVEVLSVKNLSPPNITFRYMISIDAAPKYGWRLYQKGWTKCSSICEGFQYRKPVCVELVNGQEVHSSYCNINDKESATEKRQCNTNCSLTWHIVSRSACSAHCGNGYRQVYYKCMKLHKKKHYNTEDVASQHCNVLAKPPSTEICYTSCNTTRWDYSSWSECSQTCGGGSQRRSAKCVDERNIPIDDSHCINAEKTVEQVCNIEKCPHWFTDENSACSVPCGGGHQNITSYCVLGGRIYDALACDQRTRPPKTKSCNEHSCGRWSPTDTFHPCSVSCGEGIEKRRYLCKKFDSDEVLDQEYCRSARVPREETRKCFKKCDRFPSTASSSYNYNRYSDIIGGINNEIDTYGRHTTSFQWVAGDWSSCSQTCDGGISTQTFVCRNELGDENILKCDQRKKPADNMIRCNNQPCPMWKVGDWSPTCDSNFERHRQVRCMDDRMVIFSDDRCDLEKKPQESAKCQQEAPPNKNVFRHFRWKVHPWNECSSKCGRGTRRRVIECADTLNDILVVDSYCRNQTKPKQVKGCERYQCKFVWIDGPWSSCSATCDYGTKTRNVTCHRVHQAGIVDPAPMPENHHRLGHRYCDMAEKPSRSSRCLVSKCGDEYMWQTGDWKSCSKSCGRKGRQLREVNCISVRTGQKVPRSFCPKSLRPNRKRKCNQRRCLYTSCWDIKNRTRTTENKDYFMLVHGRAVNVYCYLMDTPNPLEYISLHPAKDNYAEVYDRRLLKLDSCPYGGDRRDNCHCDQLRDRYGMTEFWKVRLNITSLKIIGDDYTFSKQIKGTPVPYGTSGDCYSSTSACPQGRFSVDLTHTSFKLARYVQWKRTGNYVSGHVTRLSDTLVRGKCGGYCGNCEPDPDFGGLKVEIT